MNNKGKSMTKNSQKSPYLLKITLLVVIFTRNHKIYQAAIPDLKLAA
jgi:hypothetical protein